MRKDRIQHFIDWELLTIEDVIDVLIDPETVKGVGIVALKERIAKHLKSKL